jgi:hypothetical protein
VAELVDRMAVLAAFRRFLSMCDTDSHSLRFDIHVRMQHFVRRSTYVLVGLRPIGFFPPFSFVLGCFHIPLPFLVRMFYI